MRTVPLLFMKGVREIPGGFGSIEQRGSWSMATSRLDSTKTTPASDDVPASSGITETGNAVEGTVLPRSGMIYASEGGIDAALLQTSLLLRGPYTGIGDPSGGDNVTALGWPDNTYNRSFLS